MTGSALAESSRSVAADRLVRGAEREGQSFLRGQVALVFRQVNDGFAGAITGQTRDDLPFGDHLAAVDAYVGDDAVAVGLEH